MQYLTLEAAIPDEHSMTPEPFHRPSPIAHRPLVGAHRGASARAPENTLAAFRAALEDGAELVELDVHPTRDGALAVIHDGETWRTTGVRAIVASLTMDELRRLDAGQFKGPAWAGEGVPELGDVFQLLRGHALVNVEVKGGVAALPALERRVREHGMADDVIVSSFDRATVRAAAHLRPALRTGLLVDGALDDPAAAARDVGAALLHLKHHLVTAEVVVALRDAGLGVLAWTVNDPAEMRRLAALGVDAILSDDPRLLRATLR